MALVAGSVGLANHIEYRGQSLRRVHVVFERAADFFLRRIGKIAHFRTGASRESSHVETSFEVPQAFHGIGCLLESLKGKVQLFLIGNRGQQITDRRWLVALQNEIAGGVDVSETLRHFLAFHQQKANMHPIARESFAGSCFRLRNLVLVVRKDQILTPKVNVKRFTQVFHRHGRAFDVPAGAARADLGLPLRLARLWRLPKSEVAHVIFFVLIDVDPSAV